MPGFLFTLGGSRVEAVINQNKEYGTSSLKWIYKKLNMKRKTVYYILLMLFMYETTTIVILCSCTSDLEYIYSFHHINFNHFNYLSYFPYLVSVCSMERELETRGVIELSALLSQQIHDCTIR